MIKLCTMFLLAVVCIELEGMRTTLKELVKLLKEGKE